MLFSCDVCIACWMLSRTEPQLCEMMNHIPAERGSFSALQGPRGRDWDLKIRRGGREVPESEGLPSELVLFCIYGYSYRWIFSLPEPRQLWEDGRGQQTVEPQQQWVFLWAPCGLHVCINAMSQRFLIGCDCFHSFETSYFTSGVSVMLLDCVHTIVISSFTLNCCFFHETCAALPFSDSQLNTLRHPVPSCSVNWSEISLQLAAAEFALLNPSKRGRKLPECLQGRGIFRSLGPHRSKFMFHVKGRAPWRGGGSELRIVMCNRHASVGSFSPLIIIFLRCDVSAKF